MAGMVLIVRYHANQSKTTSIAPKMVKKFAWATLLIIATNVNQIFLVRTATHPAMEFLVNASATLMEH